MTVSDISTLKHLFLNNALKHKAYGRIIHIYLMILVALKHCDNDRHFTKMMRMILSGRPLWRWRGGEIER